METLRQINDINNPIFLYRTIRSNYSPKWSIELEKEKALLSEFVVNQLWHTFEARDAFDIWLTNRFHRAHTSHQWWKNLYQLTFLLDSELLRLQKFAKLKKYKQGPSHLQETELMKLLSIGDFQKEMITNDEVTFFPGIIINQENDNIVDLVLDRALLYKKEYWDISLVWQWRLMNF